MKLPWIKRATTVVFVISAIGKKHSTYDGTLTFMGS